MLTLIFGSILVVIRLNAFVKTYFKECFKAYLFFFVGKGHYIIVMQTFFFASKFALQFLQIFISDHQYITENPKNS